MSAADEGVIKYRLNWSAGEPPPAPRLALLAGWRQVLLQLGLIGADPQRYGGYGFGNISCRSDTGGFFITASQTGELAQLAPGDFTVVRSWDLDGNSITASGAKKPSSEALTHAAIYATDARVAAVFHVHSPALWQARTTLGLPCTSAQIEYGTSAMARALGDHARQTGPAGIIAMDGHEDGILSYGADEAAAGSALVALLARSQGLSATAKL